MAEYGPGVLADTEFRDDLKYALPQHEDVAAEVDAFLDGPVCAALVAAAQGAHNAPPELEPAPVLESAPTVTAEPALAAVPAPDDDIDLDSMEDDRPSAFISSLAAQLRARAYMHDDEADLEMSPLPTELAG